MIPNSTAEAAAEAEARDDAGRTGGPLVTPLFAAATFLGAFLLFLVQPLIARYVLPWFGGGAAVWTTCMLFFQTALLGGYLYAHLGVSRLGTRAQAAVHAFVLLGAAAAALPAIVPTAHWQPSPGEAAPIPRILLLLAATVGLPCIALAATSPLLHAWYARLRPGAAVYRLYALSNVGSLLALFAYPFVVEPLLARRAQATVWSTGMAAFAVLCAACAWIAGRSIPRLTSSDTIPGADANMPAAHVARPPTSSSTTTTTTTTTWEKLVRRLLWIALPACASALMLGTTNMITQDIAPMPLLWVLPLALYLLTFVIAFDRPRWYVRKVWAPVLALAVIGVLSLLYMGGDVDSVTLVVVGFLAAMFVGCMTLHGELARLRPPPKQLTGYYLSLAAGGALGGLLVAVAAPLLLRSYLEYPAALWACCVLVFVTPCLIERWVPSSFPGLLALAGVLALAPLAWRSAHRSIPKGELVSRNRDFYGVLTVWRMNEGEGRGTMIHHGSITHGHQYSRPSLRATPTTYYHDESGVGFALREADSPLPRPRRVAAIGLGAGTIAAYARRGDAYRFYEISRQVARIARDNFTYLSDAGERGATVDVVLGDGRLSMAAEPEDQQFDCIVLDAFSGDAIPSHLITTEAFEMYKRRLAPGGVICVHVSNRFLDLQTVVAAVAGQVGWRAALFDADWTDAMRYPASWVVLGPDANVIQQLERNGEGTPLEPPRRFTPWTDEHANVLAILQP
jgi:SAM-dependent methyltransferase